MLAPSEMMRKAMPPESVAPFDAHGRAILGKLAATEARTLAIMHGSSYHGDGSKLLHALADALSA